MHYAKWLCPNFTRCPVVSPEVGVRDVHVLDIRARDKLVAVDTSRTKTSGRAIPDSAVRDSQRAWCKCPELKVQGHTGPGPAALALKKGVYTMSSPGSAVHAVAIGLSAHASSPAPGHICALRPRLTITQLLAMHRDAVMRQQQEHHKFVIQAIFCQQANAAPQLNGV